MSDSIKLNMSEVENTSADIDNNVQKTPKATPSKRLTNSERARIESELLVKALGGSLEGGRRTRSSTRGSPAPSPIIQEPVKRKAPTTPRRPKKVKTNIVDEIDAGDAGNAIQKNHLSQNASDNIAQAIEEEQTTKPVKPEVVVERVKEVTETATEPIEILNDQKMDVDLVENRKDTQESVPSTQQPIEETITITIDGDSLNASPEASNEPTSPPTEDKVTPSVADTTTAVILEVVDSNASESQKNKNSPNDDVTIIITSPTESVSPPNEPSECEPDNVVTPPDVVPIGIVEVYDDDTTNGKENEATIEAQTKIVDLSVAENEIESVVGNNNIDHSNDVEIVQDVVGSTNNETLSEDVEADKKSDVTVVAVNSPMGETITTTSETVVEPPATTV